MFRVCGKICRDNRVLKDLTVCNGQTDTRTHKVFQTLEEICHAFDLSIPYWLEPNIREFQRNKKTRFRQDNFVDEIDFDYLEFQVIEED